MPEMDCDGVLLTLEINFTNMYNYFERNNECLSHVSYVRVAFKENRCESNGAVIRQYEWSSSEETSCAALVMN